MDNNAHKETINFVDKLKLYQAANSDSESIKHNFVVRQAEFDTIISTLKRKKVKESLQHELILGRRGSGKSTLLKRLQIEIEENPQLHKRYIPINLAEEQAGIYRLLDLWDEVINELCQLFQLDLELEPYDNFEDHETFTRYLYENIHKILKKERKKVVLLLDNFDRIVENFVDDGNLLREILINHNDIQIIGGSTRMDEHFWAHDKPFYQFFRIHHLDALSTDEIHTLINHWSTSLQLSKIKDFVIKNPGKIENIRILTDGLPRTLQFFIQLLLRDSELYGYEYLQKIMDESTPLFQERLNYLSPPLRKVVVEMAFIWEAVPTKTLAQKCRMPSKLVAAHLNTLIDKGLVEKIPTGTKNHLYRIAERFFNMWLIITQGNPTQKRKAKWLSIFLENWYGATELRTLAQTHINVLKEKRLPYGKAVILAKGLSQTRHISILERNEILELTARLSNKDAADKWIGLPQTLHVIINEATELKAKGDYTQAIKLVKSIENEADGWKFALLSELYKDQGELTKTEEQLLLAVEKGNIDALYNLANLYADQERYDLAEQYYLKAIDKDIIDALNNLANLYADQERYDLAEQYYLKAIDKDIIDALNNLAILYHNQERYDLAEQYYLKAIDKDNIAALYNLAMLYKDQERYDLAEQYYLKAIDKNNIAALYNLANLYHNQERYDLAEQYYLKAIDKDNIAALSNLAMLYYRQNLNKKEALHYFNEYTGKKQASDDSQVIKEAILHLWNGIFDKLEHKVTQAIETENEDNLSGFFGHLLIHQQKSLLLRIFEHPKSREKLQEKYSVIYYLLQLLNANKKQREALKRTIPPELKETLNDMEQTIKERQVFYGYL